MKYSKYFAFIVFLLASNTSLFSIANWTIMIYMQSNNNLSSFAAKNIKAMTAVGSNKNLNTLVQWRKSPTNDIWRYKVNKGKYVLEQKKESSSYSYKDDIVDFVKWSSEKYPAKHFALVLWNHGSGVIDPMWGNFVSGRLSHALYRHNPRTSIASQLIKSTNPYRGIMFDEKNKMYITNEELARILKQITETVLKKKLDIFGMDACFMQMMGVLYPIKDYAKYCVSSEEAELAQGWHYAPFLYYASQDNITPLQLSKAIVSTFETLYKNKTYLYTQSVIELEHLELLKSNIDVFSQKIQKCFLLDKTNIKYALSRARKLCLQFTAPHYIDLHSFYTEFNLQLKKSLPRITTKLRQSADYRELKKCITDGIKIIEKIVISQTASKRFERAKGISIYYPHGPIHITYVTTDFAQNCKWIEFLKTVLGKKVV